MCIYLCRCTYFNVTCILTHSHPFWKACFLIQICIDTSQCSKMTAKCTLSCFTKPAIWNDWIRSNYQKWILLIHLLQYNFELRGFCMETHFCEPLRHMESLSNSLWQLYSSIRYCIDIWNHWLQLWMQLNTKGLEVKCFLVEINAKSPAEDPRAWWQGLTYHFYTL